MKRTASATEPQYLLRPDETELRGRWQLVDGKVRGDATTRRIEWLLGHHLTRIADRPSAGG